MSRQPEMVEINAIKTTTKGTLSKKKTKPAKFDIKALYTSLVKELKEKLSIISLKPSTLHVILKYVLELIEETPVKGSEQKELAIKILKEVFETMDDSEEKTSLLQLLNDGTISNMIDLIVDATKGRLNVNSAKKVLKGCLNICLK